MSEQEAESSEEQSDQGLAGLQESQLDSVTGGGNPSGRLMDLQDAQNDTIKKGDDSDLRETKESGRDGGSREGAE